MFGKGLRDRCSEQMFGTDSVRNNAPSQHRKLSYEPKTYRGGSRNRSIVAIYSQNDLLLESLFLSSLPLLCIGSSDLLPERSTSRANLLLERPRYDWSYARVMFANPKVWLIDLPLGGIRAATDLRTQSIGVRKEFERSQRGY